MTAVQRGGAVSGEIAPGVHRIDAEFADRFASLYLFIGADRSLLYDTGVAGTIPSFVVPYASERGLDLARITTVVVSHVDVDHFGGLGDVHPHLPNARVVAHELDAAGMEDFDTFLQERGDGLAARYGMPAGDAAVDWMREVVAPGTVDERLSTGISLDLGDRVVDVLHVPGHSLGHIAVHDPATGVLAISDAILGDAVPDAAGDPAFPPTYRYEAPYLESIEIVRDRAPRLLATAHFGVFTDGEVEAFLDLSRDFAEGLRARVADVVRHSPGEFSLADLVDTLNRQTGTWRKPGAEPALAFPVVAHVEQLADDGIVSLRDTGLGARISYRG